MNYHDITCPDMNNGDGLRVVLWVSGCNHYCKECQNKQTWDPNSGVFFSQSDLNEIMKDLDYDYISGITFSGGDPLYDTNINVIIYIMHIIKNTYGNKKNIWIYTGYTMEQIKNNQKLVRVLNYADYIIDGPYEHDKRDLTLKWRGSSNQNIWHKIDGEWRIENEISEESI